MGAISPVPFLDDNFLLKVENKIIKPTVEGIKNEKMEYMGFVFIGLIKVKDEPYVIEYNVRMGDPETEVVFPRISTDIIDLFDSLGTPKFNQLALKINPKHAATVILVSGGYPEEYEKEKIITGLSDVVESIIFHAGTKQKENGFVTNGGRVLAVTSMSDKYQEALKLSYAQIQKLGFEKMYYRKDIGFDL
jgi:phosphoribosylamine--glycine ligase